MLQAPGDYWPFTCTCGIPEDVNIDFPVRCYHKDDLIIMVIREPLRWNPPCDFCDKKKSSECPDEYEWGAVLIRNSIITPSVSGKTISETA